MSEKRRHNPPASLPPPPPPPHPVCCADLGCVYARACPVYALAGPTTPPSLSPLLSLTSLSSLRHRCHVAPSSPWEKKKLSQGGGNYLSRCASTLRRLNAHVLSTQNYDLGVSCQGDGGRGPEVSGCNDPVAAALNRMLASTSPTLSPSTPLPSIAPSTPAPTNTPSRLPTTSPTTDVCVQIHCSRDCDPQESSRGGILQCGWDAAANACKAGFVTTAGEAAARHESREGACTSAPTESTTPAPTAERNVPAARGQPPAEEDKPKVGVGAEGHDLHIMSSPDGAVLVNGNDVLAVIAGLRAEVRALRAEVDELRRA